MNRFIMKCPYCGFECETGEMLPLEIMELNNMVIDCGNCGKEIKVTKETFKEKDLCKTCEHYWVDFPLPLVEYIPHCEISDKKYGMKNIDEVVPYPCLDCPFDSYSVKK